MPLKPVILPPAFRLVTLLLAGALCSLASQAQQPKVLAPHVPLAPRMEHPVSFGKPASLQSLVGGLWMTDANFKSAIYVKNDLKTDSVTVTPILYLANGVRYALAPVTLAPSGTAIVDINDGLAQQGVAGHATLSGYVELQYQWPWAAICATVRNVDTLHSLIFMYGLQPPPSPSAQTGTAAANQVHLLEGMWWKQEGNVTGFVALSNVSQQPITATVHVTGSANDAIGDHVVSLSPHGTKLVNLPELLSSGSDRGGVAVSYDGVDQGLIINGGLEDESVGYSAHLPIQPLPIAPPSGNSAQVLETTYAELGLMMGAADPMMSFPAGTVFTPYSLARNISEQPFAVTPTLWWMQGAVARSYQLTPFTVPPHQTQRLDVPSLISQAGLKNFHGSVNLILETKGPAGGLVLSSGSVDQKNTYVFEVRPNAVLESVAKNLGYWSTGNGDDTMVTLWNPTDEPQDLVFNLFYAGGGQYGYPVRMEPRATHTFNISEIVQNRVPDAQGNLVPLGVHEGSAEIAGTQGEQEHITVAMEAGIYNVEKATCGNPCATCDGLVSDSLTPNGFTMAMGGSNQLTLAVQYNTGAQYNRNNTSTWSSSNTGVITVNTGLAHGVSVGAASASAQDTFLEPVYGNPCYLSCPFAYTSPGGSASGTVTPKILLGGCNGADVTGKTQSVVVGQQIVLWPLIRE